MKFEPEKIEKILQKFYPDSDYAGEIAAEDVNYIIRSLEMVLADINTKKAEDRERGHEDNQMNIYDYLESLE